MSGPFDFEEITEDRWINTPPGLFKAYQSKRFFVQVALDRQSACIRITVNKVKNVGTEKYPMWEQGISWDDLQAIKNAIGYSHYWCVECYPPREETVNVANMRHLWVLDYIPEFGWKQRELNNGDK